MTQKIPSFSEDKMHNKKTENYELRERRKTINWWRLLHPRPPTLILEVFSNVTELWCFKKPQYLGNKVFLYINQSINQSIKIL